MKTGHELKFTNILKEKEREQNNKKKERSTIRISELDEEKINGPNIQL